MESEFHLIVYIFKILNLKGIKEIFKNADVKEFQKCLY